jgi:outer membrane receptor protein involved in Fe transport
MFQMKPLAVAVRAAIGLAPALAALPVAVHAEDAGVVNEEIVVTGSRIQKSNLVSSSPVTQLDAEQIEMTGLTRTEDVLKSIPAVQLDMDAGQSIESDGVATVQLRNLGVSRTLVLLNGKRLPINSPTSLESGADLNFIPSALVERVEVLTGGASTVYGSDAVAGVINFILMEDFEGVKLDYQASGYNHDNDGNNAVARQADAQGLDVPTGTHMDGDIRDATFLIGGSLNDGRGNITAYATYRDIEPVTQDARDYSVCAIDSGLTNCGGSGTSAEGNLLPLTGPAAFQFLHVDGTDFAPDWTTYNFAPPSYYQRPDERYTLGAIAHYDLSDQATVYTQLMFMDDRTVAQFAPAGFFFDPMIDIRCDNPLVSASQKALLGCVAPTDVIQDVYVGRRNVEGGPRFGDLRHTTYRGVFGLKGDINETWRYDVSWQYSEVDMRNRNGNYVDTSRILKALDVRTPEGGGPPTCQSVIDGSDPLCVPWNIWTSGAVTPDQTAYFASTFYERGTTDQRVVNAYVQGSLGDYGIKSPWAESGIELVLGVEQREENLEYNPDDASQAGNVGGITAPLVPTDGGYTVDEIFTEANIPLVEGAPFMEALTLEVGYRYSDYDTDVDADTYKFAGSWTINDDIRVRASYQRAIRAGNIVELFQPLNGTLFAADVDPCADVNPTTQLSGLGYTFEQCARSGVSQAVWDLGGPISSPAAQYNAITGGSEDIEPEESDTVSFGFAFTPSFVPGLTIIADWYDIEVTDAIFQIEPLTTLTQCIENNQFCEKVHRGPGETLFLGGASPTNGVETFYENIASFRVKGVDVEASYDLQLGDMGSLTFSTLFGWVDSFEQEEYDGADVLECAGVYGGSCQTPLPEYRNHLTATWATPWNAVVSLTWRYIDEVKQIATDTPVDQDEISYYDIAGKWNATDNIAIRAGINNIFDKEPPLSDNGVTVRNNGNTYPGVYDHLGQYMFLGMSVEL